MTEKQHLADALALSSSEELVNRLIKQIDIIQNQAAQEQDKLTKGKDKLAKENAALKGLLDDCHTHGKILKEKLDRLENLLKTCIRQARRNGDDGMGDFALQVQELGSQVDELKAKLAEERGRAEQAEERVRELSTDGVVPVAESECDGDMDGVLDEQDDVLEDQEDLDGVLDHQDDVLEDQENLDKPTENTKLEDGEA